MSLISYTAKRSLVPGHQVEQVYVLNVDISEATPGVEDIKTEERSTGGGGETVFHRQDRRWDIAFAPMRGMDLLMMREFMDSIESGQAFQMEIYEGEPLGYFKWIDSEHGEDVFMRVGLEESDWYQVRGTFLETTDVDPSITLDVFAPGGGGGGLLDPVEFGGVVTFTCVSGGGYGTGGSLPMGFSTIPGTEDGTLHSGDIAGYDQIAIETIGESGGEFRVYILVPTSEAPASPQTAFFSQVSIPGESGVKLAASPWGFHADTTSHPGYTLYRWYWGDYNLANTVMYNGGAGATVTATFS